jgi:lipid-A-disaccharide synthase-like uncharacterized protein
MWAGALSVASIIGGLIMAYLLLAHGDAVVAITKAGGSFITTESKILQGR